MPRLRLRREKPRSPLLDTLGYSDYVATGYWSKRTEAVSAATITGVLQAGAPLDWVVDISANQLFGHGEAACGLPAYREILDLTRRLRQEHGVRHPGTWVHSFVAAAADHPLRREHPDWFRPTNTGDLLPDLDCPAAFAFYDQGCALLRELGFDHLKLDFPMAGFDHFGNRKPLEEVFRTLYGWWQDACERNGLTIIGCQGVLSEVWSQFDRVNVCRVSADWHASAAPTINPDCTSGGAPLSREGIDRATRHHIVDSFFSGHYLKHVCWPDFDMFQTHDREARAYAVAVALSGGLVYLADEPDRVDLALLRRLLLHGSRLARLDEPGRPLERHFFENPTAPGRAFWVHGAANGIAVAAGFNLAEDRQPVEATLPVEEILPDCDRAVVWAHDAATACPWRRGQAGGPSVRLAFGEAEVFIIAPWRDHEPAAIGLVDRFVSPCGVSLRPDAGAWTLLAQGDGEVALVWPWPRAGVTRGTNGQAVDATLAGPCLRLRVERDVPYRIVL